MNERLVQLEPLGEFGFDELKALLLDGFIRGCCEQLLIARAENIAATMKGFSEFLISR